MSSRKVLHCVFLLFALLSSPTAAEVCRDSTRLPPDCTELDLPSKSLASLDLSTRTFTNLLKINLNFNELSEMPRLPASAKATLQRLELYRNKIASVPADYFSDFRSLTKLDLQFNELSEMPRLPASAKATLQRLWLSRNKIASVPADYFNDFRSLTWLDLQFNELSEMPRLPASAKATLQRLGLSGIKIASFPADYFNDFRSLTWLDLGDNELTEMPGIPDFVKTKLTGFSISRNKISEIPAGYFSDFSELSDLWLHENKIPRFPPGTSLGHLSKLRWLRVDQMDCDCATRRLWQQIAAMTNISHLEIFKNGNSTDFPCAGALGGTTLRELRTTTCTTAAPPTPTSGIGEIEILIIAIVASILLVGILILIFLVLRRRKSSSTEDATSGGRAAQTEQREMGEYGPGSVHTYQEIITAAHPEPETRLNERTRYEKLSISRSRNS